MKIKTQINTLGRNSKNQKCFINPPIYKGSTIIFKNYKQYKKEKSIYEGLYGLNRTPNSNALESALKDALINFYPDFVNIHLIDYKVRIFDPSQGSAAGVRVFIESSDNKTSWSTVGSSTDVIEASFLALQDSYEYWLINQ